MKAFVIILLVSCACRSHKPENVVESAAVVPAAESISVKLDFEKDIQPILQSHCTPCHFKDGKMYARMPFDQSRTLVEFQQGILRRLKNEEEVAKIKEYLSQLN